MYFNHAFKKVFPTVAAYVDAAGNTYSQLTGTDNLGKFGMYDAKTYANLTIPAVAATASPFIIASSSLTPGNDKQPSSNRFVSLL